MKRLFLSVLKLVDKCQKDHIDAYAAQTAFFFIMSLVPLVIFFISLIQYTPITETMLLHWTGMYLPDYIQPFAVTILDEVYTNSVGFVSTSAIVSVWSAGKGIYYLTNGLDVVHGVEEKRNWFLLRIKSIFITFLFLLAIIAFMLLVVFGHLLENILLVYVPMIGMIVSAVLEIRFLIVFPMMTLFFVSIYQGLPNRKAILSKNISIREQLPGAVLCTLAWYLLSVGISIYVSYFHGFSMYGSLTTIILLMFWVYFCMYLLMFFAEFNEILRQER